MVKLNPILSQLLLGKKFYFINLNYGCFLLHIYLESRLQKMARCFEICSSRVALIPQYFSLIYRDNRYLIKKLQLASDLTRRRDERRR